MSTPAPSLRGSTSLSKPRFLSDSEKPSFLGEFYGLVSNRAYSLFEEFGHTHGDDLAHWLQAERELASFPAIQESKDAFTVTMHVGEIPAEQIKVCATDEKVMVSAKSDTTESDSRETQSSSREARSLYYLAVWPQPVSADSYQAEVRNGILTVTVQKAPRAETRPGSSARVI